MTSLLAATRALVCTALRNSSHPAKARPNWIMPNSMRANTGRIMANSTKVAPSSSRRGRRNLQERTMVLSELLRVEFLILQCSCRPQLRRAR